MSDEEKMSEKMPDEESKAKEYLEKELKKGFPINEIREALLKTGYSKEIIEKICKEKIVYKEKTPKILTKRKVTKTQFVYGAIIAVLLIIIVSFFILHKKPYEKDSRYEECLNQSAQLAGECIALMTGNPEACDIFADNDPNSAIWCKVKITKDRSLCELTSDNFWDYHNCLIDTAQTVEDCNAIDYSNEPYEINECLAYVTGDVAYCDKLPEKDMLDCKANLIDDISLCKENPNFQRKWTCIFQHSKDLKLCDEYVKEYCRLFIENPKEVIEDWYLEEDAVPN